MSKFVISRQASLDLDQISDYFLERSIEAGERWFTAFNQRCLKLVRFPSMGRSYAEIRPYLRGLPLEGFIIFYRLQDDGIEIMRVVSGRRNFDDVFPNDE